MNNLSTAVDKRQLFAEKFSVAAAFFEHYQYLLIDSPKIFTTYTQLFTA